MAILNDNRELFKNLTTSLSSVFINRSSGDTLLIKKILDDLNKLNFRYPTVENASDAILFIHNCCMHIVHDDDILVPKCCRLMTKLINLQKLQLENRTFNDLLNWCLSILAFPERKETQTVEVLILLDALVRSSNSTLGDYILTVLDKNSALFKVLEEGASPAILRYGLQCLEACTIIDEIKSEKKLEKLKVLMVKCMEIFQSNLLNSKKFNDATDLKIKIICFRGLENIFRKFDDILDTTQILGIVKYYMLLGIRDSECLEVKPVLPSSMSIPEPKSNCVREKKGGKVTKLRKRKVIKQKENPTSEDWMKPSLYENITDNYKIPPLTSMITSDSDISDTGIPKADNLPRLQSRVRQMSFSLLLTVAKILQKAMLTYWTSFIPEYSGSGKLFLTNCILEDPSIDCRKTALNVLVFMLTSAKLCLLQADSCDRSTSFTPFSAILGSMIVCLHECLNSALKDKITSVLAQVLKCYAALVEVTPYKRLKPGLISEVVHNVNPLLYHKDPTIKTGALIVLGCILASEPVVEETKNLFLKNSNESGENNTEYLQLLQELTKEEKEKICKLPEILRTPLRYLQINKENVSEPLPVKIESIKIISCMCRNYFDCLVYPYLDLIGKAVCDCLLDKNFDLKLHGGRAIDCIGQAMCQFLQESESTDDGKEAPGVTFWRNLLDGPLTNLFPSDVEVALRATSCYCLGSIGCRILGNLPINKHFLIITHILSCCKDEEAAIKAAAVRALGLLIHYPILREEIGFVMDTAEAIFNTLNDNSIDVRIKSSWALGNFSDILVSNSTNEVLREFPALLMVNLLKKSVKALTLMKSNEKVKANLARAMGNLLHLIDHEGFEHVDYKDIVESSVVCLMNSASTGYNMKVRWNSCYALGLLLKNEAIYINTQTWVGKIFTTLNNLVTDFKNFKVRTSAALALASPSERKYYGIYYQNTWTALLKSLENTQYIDDYTEYQHKNRLIEQVCLSLSHMLSLSQKEDLPLMRENLNSYYEICKSQMKYMCEILVPEKSNIIFTAAEHLKSFNDLNVSAETKEAIFILQDVFVQDF